MTDKQQPPSPKDFQSRLRAARERRSDRTGKGGGNPKQGIGFAFRIGTDLVAAVAVGTGIGLGLDYWWGTKPWMLVVFFILGSAAGMLNVYRAVGGYGYAVGYDRSVVKQDDSDQSSGTDEERPEDENR